MAYESLIFVCCICMTLQHVLRFMRLKTLLFLLILAFLGTIVIRVIIIIGNSDSVFEEVDGVCRHPNLDINNEMIAQYIEDVGELTCDKKPNWISVHKGSVFMNQKAIDSHGDISCIITYLVRDDDFTTSPGKKLHFTSAMKTAKLESDFFTVQCSAKDGATWRNVMAGIHRNETVVNLKKGTSPPSRAWNLNVLMFGLDSMSRMHFMRKLPSTYSYLTKILGATVLQGYNIVGDGTPQALIPILTGMAEPELPETRHRMEGASHVNVYPFIWKEFAANGYVTAYGEDMAYVGTFTYRMTGFDEQPTDHYMRPFYIKAETIVQNHPKFCLRNTPRHRVMLDWLRQFYDVYHDMQKFSFLFHSELSHDNYNTVGYIDPDLESFLRELERDGILNNTLLIVMSDHGHRFANIRETQQGKEEERLPFFSIRLPPWFETVHPKAFHNLRANEHRLTTPFDIYNTLLTILYPDVPDYGDIEERSISLFSEVPEERSCADADIEPHWCACLNWISMPLDSDEAYEVAQAVIDYINEMTDPYRELCASLTLDEVGRLEKLVPNRALLKFKQNADYDGFEGDFTDDTDITEIYYEVQVRVLPSYGLYEAAVRYNVLKESFDVFEKDISRINLYAGQETCIHDSVPRLGKYCYCNDLL